MEESILTSVKNKLEKNSIQKKPLCIICEEKESEYCIKGIPKDCYCKECAEESFGSLDFLEKL
ncbi:MAG: hypothetical protein QXM96_01220 [Candidatus Woesearchaeota archaeon]